MVDYIILTKRGLDDNGGRFTVQPDGIFPVFPLGHAAVWF